MLKLFPVFSPEEAYEGYLEYTLYLFASLLSNKPEKAMNVKSEGDMR